ncbi:MAG: exopolyphosphatase [Phenylobacterium sp.]|jgi:exopolyphosphatase/guanosine-5'-triphosphate,3'-diphosphate pyrophosphatase|nr:exopolyphosphatase [Phenylobacterium sp.]
MGDAPCYAALDLGTNNCRLLIATPSASGFRVIEAFSRIVRLGEGLSQSGRLSEAAMERAMAALKVSAEKVRRRRVVRLRAIATQACRMAENGPAFIARVAEETGLALQIITPQEEARLSVAGCLNLLDRTGDAALVVDVGGGSTELSWVELKGAPPTGSPPVRAWLSIPMGVVTLAERFPEGETATQGWYRQMVDTVKGEIAAFRRADSLRAVFDADRAHLIGTSGAITSLAGLHLNLPRYDRNKVDGIWMTRAECDAAAGRLLALNPQERAQQPCIGPDRADLVLAGAAILQAVQELWPCSRVRVADRGLREGILISLMSDRGRRRKRRRRSAAPALAVA